MVQTINIHMDFNYVSSCMSLTFKVINRSVFIHVFLKHPMRFLLTKVSESLPCELISEVIMFNSTVQKLLGCHNIKLFLNISKYIR